MIVLNSSYNVKKRKIGSEFSSVFQLDFIRRYEGEGKRETEENMVRVERETQTEIENWVSLRTKREKKRLIRKPDQVGPGLPVLGSLCYVWSCRGW